MGNFLFSVAVTLTPEARKFLLLQDRNIGSQYVWGVGYKNPALNFHSQDIFSFFKKATMLCTERLSENISIFRENGSLILHKSLTPLWWSPYHIETSPLI